MRARLIIGVFTLGIAVAAVIAWVIAHPPAIDPVAPPAASSFPADLVDRGRVLARIGDCGVCHTRPDGGAAFAGGRALPTPFGTIYARNITPDMKTGLGTWSRAAFARAMREGVSPDGQFIYPAHPYDHFTLLTDDDLAALYAYVMTRAPVDAPIPVAGLRFPFNQRQLMAGWNLLFLRRGPYQPDPKQSTEWNRGAYLVEGAGHCGACHTPRNIMGAEQKDRAFAGAMAEDWYAPPLDGNSLALLPWTVDSLQTYLSRGHEPRHGVAGGPMADVAANLGDAPAADVQAMATYLVGQMATPSPEQARQAKIEDQQVELVRGEGGVGLGAARDLVDGIARAAQRAQQAVREDLVVFGDQDAHRLSPGPSAGFRSIWRWPIFGTNVARSCRRPQIDFSGGCCWLTQRASARE